MKETIMWKTGKDQLINLNDINSIIKDHIENNGQIIIGSDSMLTSEKIVFVNAICLIGKNSPHHCKFFYNRYLEKDQSNKQGWSHLRTKVN